MLRGCCTRLSRLGKDDQQMSGPFSTAEINDTRDHWICFQGIVFCLEMDAIAAGKPVPSPLCRLNPFDARGFLRVGGRIKNSALSPDQRHPMLLSKDSHLTNLVTMLIIDGHSMKGRS